MKRLIKKVQQTYNELPAELVCPVFDSPIKVTRAGYNHLVKEKERTEGEIQKRLLCLSDVPVLFEKSVLMQDYQYTYTKSGRVDFYMLQGVVRKKIIRAIVRKVGSQAPHLYSVVFKGTVPRKKQK